MRLLRFSCYFSSYHAGVRLSIPRRLFFQKYPFEEAQVSASTGFSYDAQQSKTDIDFCHLSIIYRGDASPGMPLLHRGRPLHAPGLLFLWRKRSKRPLGAFPQTPRPPAAFHPSAYTFSTTLLAQRSNSIATKANQNFNIVEFFSAWQEK